MTPTTGLVRLAALADIHYARTSAGSMASLFGQIADAADVLLLGGDLTDSGHPEEAMILAKDLAQVKIPVVAVLGNHDVESACETELEKIFSDVGVHLLDGESWIYRDVGFAGCRGFCGGFGRGALGPWGEKVIKAFVHEAVEEALKLEGALARLDTQHRIVLLHYAPIRETVEGEPLEIFPFLGSSRLEDPISRFQVTAVFHGHAHKGQPEGKTQSGIPVYNVAHAVLKANYPDRPAFRVFELNTTGQGDSGVTPIVERRQHGRRASDRSSERAPSA